MVPTVCFVACHGGPADHFAVYAQELMQRGYKVEIHATGVAIDKFNMKGVEVHYLFSLDGLTVEEQEEIARKIAKISSTAVLVFTDVGHPFNVKIQKGFKEHASHVIRTAYYDNPEPFVPGGYSATAAQVMEVADEVWFANNNVAKDKVFSAPNESVNLEGKKRVGMGYYPISDALAIKEKRKVEYEVARTQFFKDNGIEDFGQMILVYFGGNNDEYYDKAFPKFLEILAKTSLENVVVVLQQHPGALKLNRDGQLFNEWKKNREFPQVVTSTLSSEAVQLFADRALYYQTSMGLQFAIADIPAVQVGHETYPDVLVRNKLAPSATNAEEFVHAN